MTKIDQLKEIIADYPEASNSELARRLDENTSRGAISVYLSRLKQRGELIEQEENGKRVLALTALPEKTESFKHTVYEAMIDRFLVDFDEAETYQARLDIARIIMRLLQYI